VKLEKKQRGNNETKMCSGWWKCRVRLSLPTLQVVHCGTREYYFTWQLVPPTLSDRFAWRHTTPHCGCINWTL